MFFVVLLDDICLVLGLVSARVVEGITHGGHAICLHANVEHRLQMTSTLFVERKSTLDTR